MTLRARLSLTIAAVAVLLVLPAAYAVKQLNTLRTLVETQHEQHGRAYIALGRLQFSLSNLKQLATEYFITPAPPRREAMVHALQEARDHIRELDATGYRLPARRASTHVNQIGVATRRFELLVDANRRDDAVGQLDSARALISAIDPVIESIATEIDRRSSENLVAAADISSRAANAALAALLICVGVALLFGVLTTRSLTQPVEKLSAAMMAVADGNFTVPSNLDYARRDEIGSVTRSFRAMTHRLADLDRLKGEFLSFATHELRTPLNVVSGYSDLLREGTYGPMSAAQRDAVDAIRDQTRVIAQLVNQLLDIGRLEAGGLRVQIRPSSSAELFQRVERSFEPLAQQKGVALTVNVEDSVPATLVVDAERLSDQVLGNLLSNALKFTPEGGRIQVHAHLIDGALAIDVADSGPGIPLEKLPLIFEKYYQVSDEARRKGAGLGLSIARDVVRAHGGTIHAESEPGHGTTFRVLLPTPSAGNGAPSLTVRA
jgi:signal transduction histidine kinase